MSSSGNHAFNAKNNKRQLPPGIATTNQGTVYQSASGFQLASDRVNFGKVKTNSSGSFPNPVNVYAYTGMVQPLNGVEEISNNHQTVNVGQYGGINHKPNRIVRVRSNNITRLIRAGQWNMQSGYFSNTAGTAEIQPTYSNSVGSGIKTGILVGGDTVTGQAYQQHSYFQLNTVGNSGQIGSYLHPKKTS